MTSATTATAAKVPRQPKAWFIGARIRLHEIYKSGAERMTLDDYCYYHIYLLGTLCKLDEATMDENIREAFEFTRRHAPPEHRVFG